MSRDRPYQVWLSVEEMATLLSALEHGYTRNPHPQYLERCDEESRAYLARRRETLDALHVRLKERAGFK